LTDLVIVAAIAAAVLVVGIRVGMLLGPRIGRLTSGDDEEGHDDREG
jgi:hypothetical protein